MPALALDPLKLTKRYSAQVRRDTFLSSEHALQITLDVKQVPGTYLTLQAEFQQERLQALGYKIRSCAIGHAALGILIQYAEGMTLAHLNQAQQQLEEILSSKLSDYSQLIWPELILFSSAVTLIERHPVALLPFQALRTLFLQASTQET